MVKISIIATLTLASLASVQAAEPEIADPSLKFLLQNLKSNKGPCCSTTDRVALVDVAWENVSHHYRVRIEGKWWDVPDDAVVVIPNKSGRTMVWPIYTWGFDGLESVEVQCFMPGGMS